MNENKIAKFMLESARGISDKRLHTEDVHHLDVKIDLQIREALQQQLDTQRRLHEQFEFQRALLLRNEEQDQQQRTSFRYGQ